MSSLLLQYIAVHISSLQYSEYPPFVCTVRFRASEFPVVFPVFPVLCRSSERVRRFIRICVASYRSLPLRTAPHRFVPPRIASYRSVPLRTARVRLLPVRIASVRIVSYPIAFHSFPIPSLRYVPHSFPLTFPYFPITSSLSQGNPLGSNTGIRILPRLGTYRTIRVVTPVTLADVSLLLHFRFPQRQGSMKWRE